MSVAGELPGMLMDRNGQTAVTGMACGQSPSTTGQGLCAVAAVTCATVPTTRPGQGPDCAVPGAACAACAGAHIILVEHIIAFL